MAAKNRPQGTRTTVKKPSGGGAAKQVAGAVASLTVGYLKTHPELLDKAQESLRDLHPADLVKRWQDKREGQRSRTAEQIAADVPGILDAIDVAIDDVADEDEFPIATWRESARRLRRGVPGMTVGDPKSAKRKAKDLHQRADKLLLEIHRTTTEFPGKSKD